MREGRWLAAIVALGVVARVLTWWLTGGFHHPDELFQYLEPANYLRTGVASLPWEFQRGVRSWIPPAYYAALLEVLEWCGLSGLAAQRALTLHNALFTLLLIPAAFRVGAVLQSNAYKPELNIALWSALFAATLPALNYFTPRTLIGTPAMLAFAWGVVFWLEARRDQENAERLMLWCGLMFGVAGSLRILVGFHMLIPLLDLLFRYRRRALVRLLQGAALPVLLFGFVDAFTWGSPFHSTVEYLKYNYFEGPRESPSPWHFYFTNTHFKAFGPIAAVSLVVVAASLRVGWLLAVTLAVPTIILSTVSYKAHRLLMANWFLIAIMLGIGVALIAREVEKRWLRGGATVAAVLAAAVIVSNAIGIAGWPWTWARAMYRAQDFVGARDDASGLLLENRRHLNGGYVILQRTIPQVLYQEALARRGLFNYAALFEYGADATELKRRGWTTQARFDEVVVLQRPTPSALPPAPRVEPGSLSDQKEPR